MFGCIYDIPIALPLIHCRLTRKAVNGAGLQLEPPAASTLHDVLKSWCKPRKIVFRCACLSSLHRRLQRTRMTHALTTYGATAPLNIPYLFRVGQTDIPWRYWWSLFRNATSAYTPYRPIVSTQSSVSCQRAYYRLHSYLSKLWNFCSEHYLSVIAGYYIVWVYFRMFDPVICEVERR